MSRPALLALIAYALVFLGVVSFNGALVALALPFVVYMGAAVIFGPRPLRLVAERSLSERRTHDGESVLVSVRIRNDGGFLEDLLVEDVPPGGLTVVDGHTKLRCSVDPGESIEVAYTVVGRRGQHDFGDLHAVAADHLGLFAQQATVPAAGRLMVLPQPLKPRRVDIRPLRTRAHAGPAPARRGGVGVEFFSVRDYHPGDPPRSINWRMSARHPQHLYTNEFQQERIADVGLILDARQRSEVFAHGDSLFEHSVRATASLAEAFLSDGNRVAMLIYGAWLEWTLPGAGKVQRQRVFDALARARAGDSMIFESLDYIPTRLFPAGAQLVLVSPLYHDDAPVLARLRTRGYQVLVVSPDPIDFELCGQPVDADTALAARIARVERRLLLRTLQQAGIRVVDWRVQQGLSEAIHSAAGRAPHWFYSVGWEA